MSPALKQLFRDVRRAQIGQCVSPAVPYQHRCAIVLRKWKALEELGLVRLRREPDTGYDPSEFDEPADTEAFGSLGEFTLDPLIPGMTAINARFPFGDLTHWATADSCWGHVGYGDVLDWRENPYILDIMAATITAFRDAWKAYVHRRRQTP